MYCSFCGNKLDDDAIFCPVCGKKIKRILPTEINIPSENPAPEIESQPESPAEMLYTPENNSQPEFSPEKPVDNIAVESSEEKELENFFGSIEPIQHISSEPTPATTEEIEKMKKIMAVSTREPLPDLVLRKKNETKKETPPEENYTETPQPYERISGDPYNDNSATQYIPYEDIKENYNNNYQEDYNQEYDNYDDYQPNYEEQPPYYDPPEYESIPPYNPQPVQEYRTVKVSGFRLFSAGIVTFISVILVIVLSMLFCIKLGFSGAAVEKGIKNLDMEKVLDAEYNGNYDVNEFLYNKTNFYNITFGMAGENDFRNFVLGLDIPDFIGENVRTYADYFLNGGQKPTLTGEGIAEYMFNHSDYNNLNRNDFSNMVYNLSDGQADNMFSVDSWKVRTGFDFRLLSYIFSPVTLGIILALICVFMIWIAVIVDKQGRHLTGFYKSIFMVGGVILLIAGAVCFIAPPVVYSQTSHVLFYLISKLLTDFNIFLIATGAFEFIVGIILSFIQKLIIMHERKYRDG
ncbi:MAG: zinc-ribbon domain-containing protein [Muribaculaceae bacterium]|nr:zinc-ribbon domain-containing protein [Alistipes senegalensis]MCM1473502.1 zinc-ribbon domain-containing protein [Muribaculaceae bacterium]